VGGHCQHTCSPALAQHDWNEAEDAPCTLMQAMLEILGSSCYNRKTGRRQLVVEVRLKLLCSCPASPISCRPTAFTSSCLLMVKNPALTCTCCRLVPATGTTPCWQPGMAAGRPQVLLESVVLVCVLSCQTVPWSSSAAIGLACTTEASTCPVIVGSHTISTVNC
jgi:hypothetical protein